MSEKLSTRASSDKRQVSSGSSNRSGVSARKNAQPKKYQFHQEYLNEADAKDVPKKKTSKNDKMKNKPVASKNLDHPEIDNDGFWERQYRIVNFRKRFPNDFDKDEFDNFYNWLNDIKPTDTKLENSQTLLFGKAKWRISVTYNDPAYS